MTAITQLSAHGIKEICESENPALELQDRFYHLQVIEVKLFTQIDNKKNIKAR